MWWYVLAQVYEDLASHRYAIGKRESILMVFSDNSKYDSLIRHWKLRMSSFLMVSDSTLQLTFISELSIHYYIKIHWSIFYFEWIFYQCMISDFMNLLEKVSGTPNYTLRSTRKQFNGELNQEMKAITKSTSSYALPWSFTTFNSFNIPWNGASSL